MEQRWVTMCRGWGQAEARARVLWRILACLYASPGRHYHVLDHVAACLHLLDEFADQAEQKDEIEFALFLHDCIYVPGAGDNEICSAAQARMFAVDLGAGSDRVARIEGLVLATMHDSTDLEGDAALIADLDMAVLGSHWTEYERYARGIAAEHAGVGRERYVAGRKAFLEQLLMRTRIYQREALAFRFEAQARENIEREIQLLSTSGAGALLDG